MIDLDTLGRYWTAYMNGNTGLKHIHDSGRLFTIATSDNCAHLSCQCSSLIHQTLLQDSQWLQH